METETQAPNTAGSINSTSPLLSPDPLLPLSHLLLVQAPVFAGLLRSASAQVGQENLDKSRLNWVARRPERSPVSPVPGLMNDPGR